MTRPTQERYLCGYYPPKIGAYESIDEWEKHWSMGPHAEKGWVWFEGNFKDSAIKRRLKNPPKGDVK